MTTTITTTPKTASPQSSLVIASPIVLVRPILAVPVFEDAKPRPAYCFICPHCTAIHVVPEDLPIVPALAQCELYRSPVRPIVLSLGQEIDVPGALLKEWPNELPDELWTALEQLSFEDIEGGRRDQWLLSPPVLMGGLPMV